MQTIIVDIFREAVRAVQPSTLIPQFFAPYPEGFFFNYEPVKVKPGSRLVVVACGKAAAAMAVEVESRISAIISDGLCITKYEHGNPALQMRCIEAAHPYPDENSLRGSKLTEQLITSLKEDDIVLALISGGASSLLAENIPGTNLADIVKLYQCLVNSGASIHEVNIVRKHLSVLKGGQFSQKAYPASVYAFIISDVPGDNLDTIASGLTAADPSTFSDAITILEKYCGDQPFSPAIRTYLGLGRQGFLPETPKPGSRFLDKTTNLVIGSNSTALLAAALAADKAGFPLLGECGQLLGPVAEMAENIVSTLMTYDQSVPRCLLWGGETTLKVKSGGLGGRNQHLALSLLLEIKRRWENPRPFVILCGGTDGTDGPTLSAGAIIHSGMLDNEEITEAGMMESLVNFNSNHFFKAQGTLLMTGPTYTNVMDLVIVLVN